MDTDVVQDDAASAIVTEETSQAGKTSETKVAKEASHETIPAVHSYKIKPSLNDKFKELPVKEIIRSIMTNTLVGKSYNPENVKKWTIFIANEVNEKVKDLQMKRYRHIVHVLLGEMKGAGVKAGVRCLWDSDTDGYTSEIFMNPFQQEQCSNM